MIHIRKIVLPTIYIITGFIWGFLVRYNINNNNKLEAVMITVKPVDEIQKPIVENNSITIEKCNKLFAETTDELSIFHPDFKNHQVELYKGKLLLIDDILYGYDLIFERNSLFARSSWLGVQSQQDPSDAMAIQMLIWNLKPDLIIDLGTNTGGSALFFASIMNYYNENGKIISIDIKEFNQSWFDDKCINCTSPDKLPLWQKYVHFYKGSTIDKQILEIVKNYTLGAKCVLVSQDASHYPVDVYNDINAYADFVSVGSYLLVQDSKLDRIVRRSVDGIHHHIDKFLSLNDKFIMDRDYEKYYYYTQHAKGFLKRIK